MNSDTVRGRTVGASIMFFFGALWLLLGLYGGRASARSLRVGLLLTGMALAVCIGIMARWAVRQSSGSAPPSAEPAAVSQQTGRRFGWITAIEGGAIVLAIVLFNAIHRPQFIAPVIAIIVGLHFFPLASLFGAPVYYATGSLGCAIGITGLLISDPALRMSFVGLSFGSLLWLTVAAVLVKSFSNSTT
jgi:hypothetical protein